MGFTSFGPVILLSAWLVSLLVFGYRDFKCVYLRLHPERAPPSFGVWFVHQFVGSRKFMRQTGSFNLGGIMMLGIMMVFLGIGAIFLPISTDATSDLLAYAYSANNTITDATFTGYTSVVGITPILILVGFLTAAVVSGMMGIKIMKGSATTKNPGSVMLLGLAIVFVGIGLIMEPVMLDGFSAVLHGNGAGISSSFTGYESIVKVSPMLIHIGYLAAAVLTGFFGMKNLTAGSSSD